MLQLAALLGQFLLFGVTQSPFRGHYCAGRRLSRGCFGGSGAISGKRGGCCDIIDRLFTQIVVDAAEIFAHFAPAELIDFCHQAVEKFAVVTYDNDRPVESKDGLLQHVLGLHVEVVGRLVEYQKVDGFQQ